MFDLLTLTARDAAMLGGGAVAVASALAVVGIIHKASPAVSAWLSKEKTTLLAIEDKMKSGFGFASRAITNVEAAAKKGDADLRAEFSGATSGVAARLEKLETAVFGPANAAVIPNPATPE